MWRSKLFRRFCLVFSTLILCSAVLLVSLFSNRLELMVSQQVRERLQSIAIVLSADASQFLPNPPPEAFARKIQQLEETMSARVRLYNTEKQLLADSQSHDGKPSSVDLPVAAKEILEVEGWYDSSFAGDLLGENLVMYKINIERDEQFLGHLLVSLPRSEYESDLSKAKGVVSTIVISTSLVALIATYLLTLRVVRPIEKLRVGAERLTQADFSSGINIETGDELEELSDSFNRMSQQLDNRIRHLNEQKQEIQEGSERLRTVLGAMIEGVVAVDEEQRILFANRAAANIFDFSNREHVNRPLVEFIRHPGVLDVVEEVTHNRRLLTVEIEIPRKDIILSVIASRLPGQPTGGVVMVFHDMTELRRLENVRREFVSNVSHELKTPLASIQAYTDTLLEGGLEDPDINRKFLSRIEEQADRLHMLIVDVIKIAQVESGQEMFDMTAVDLAKCVRECVQDHLAVAESKQIQLKVIPEDQEDNLTVHADEAGLWTILDNLLDNAIKYTRDHGTVTVRWIADEKRVYLSIEDTGVGIAREHMGRIFERFYRVDKARSRDMGGTGLGLSIVKHLSQVFGGTIGVESEQGVGTIFTVELLRA